MRQCYAIEIITPKKVLLRGLWFGPKKAKRAYVWVHGLGSSVFSMQSLATRLVDGKTAVLMFNNRGHDKVSRIAHVGERLTRKTHLGGAAHEVFSESVEDIQGAVNFAKRQGVKKIFLAGHSTGCQKSIYWASRTRGRGVQGIILLAPVSDWAAEMKRSGARKVARAMKAARALLKSGKKHELLPAGLWHEVLDAQRFLSLYTPDSIEEIFPYAQRKKNPRVLKSVRRPILVLWAEKDEFSDRPAEKAVAWFEKHLQKGKTVIIPRTGHLFRGAEKQVAGTIRRWMK